MEVQHDLGFDLRFGERGEPAHVPPARHVHHRAVVDVGPHRIAHAVQRPHVRVGEADLATDRAGPFAQPRLVHELRHRVGGRHVEAVELRREGLDLPGRVLCGLDLPGQGVERGRCDGHRHACIPEASLEIDASTLAAPFERSQSLAP